MSDYIIHDSTLSGIADAIREKTGRSDAIPTVDMADEIMSISGGSANIWIGTQAELEEDFDELEDGTQINIIDDEEKVSANGTVYSLDEKCIGLWVNNKPLYQKTITFGALPNNSAKSVAHNISNIDNIVDIKGFAYSTTNGYTLPLEDLDADVTGTTGNIRLYANSTNVYIKTKSDQTAYDTVYVTIQYTKSTDSSLNGIMPGANTMYIASSDCYTDYEKEIGCWLDGKPLYKRTVIFNNPQSDRVDNLPHGIENIDTIVRYEWAAYNSEGTVISGFEGTASNYWSSIFNITKGGISYRIGSSWAMTKLIVTLCYTKTTDVAGSGRFVPSGDKAVHYGFEEQVIGTWVNNKPLYQKTIYIPNPVNDGYVNHGIENIDRVMVSEVTGSRNGTTWNCGNYFMGNGDNLTVLASNNPSQGIYTHFAMTSLKDLYVTLKYTKTTD